MKILAIITGIGYGHSIREAALLNHLKKQGHDIVIAGYGNSKEYFEKKFETLELQKMNFPERKFKFSITQTLLQNTTLPLKYFFNYLKLRKVCKIFNPDIIISDLEPIAFYLDERIPHFFIFNFNPDLYKEYVKETKKSFKFLSKIYKNIYETAAKKSYPIIIPSLSKNKVKNNLHFINPIIRNIPEKTHVFKNETPIVISLGGSYFGSEILDHLLRILPKFKEKFVIFSYKTLGKEKENIKFLPFKENFLSYLKESKAVICLGGHNTIAEAAILKKPSLVFPVPGYIEQMLNAYEVEKLDIGMSKVLKHPLKEIEIESAIKKFLEEIPQIKESLEAFNIGSNGVEQAAKIIEEKSKSK